MTDVLAASPETRLKAIEAAESRLQELTKGMSQKERRRWYGRSEDVEREIEDQRRRLDQLREAIE